MEKEKLSSELRGLVGENSLSERTWNEYIDNTVIPFLPTEQEKMTDYLSKHASALKSLNGQLNFDVANKVNDFKKNYKPEPQNPQIKTEVQPNNPQMDEDMAKQLKEFQEFKSRIEKTEANAAAVEKRIQLMSSAKGIALKKGASDETVLSLVLPIVEIGLTESDTPESIAVLIQSKYDETYSKLHGRGFKPALGSSVSAPPVITPEVKKIREKAAEERKKMKV